MKHDAIITPKDSAFPARLASIPDPPERLYIKGGIAAFQLPGIAVIGTRSPSEYGKTAGYETTLRIARQGFTIISGLAAGCDTVVHKAAVEAGVPTIAFMPCGLSHIYPPENERLARHIIAKGGCLVSEYPDNEPPAPKWFEDRDRLQSGLALGVVVIETDLNSGTMVTVRHALSQGRPIACMDSHPGAYRKLPSFTGNIRLLTEGVAYPLRKESDLKVFLQMTVYMIPPKGDT